MTMVFSASPEASRCSSTRPILSSTEADSSQVVLDVALILPAHEVVALQVGCAERVVLGLIGRVPNFELLGREPLGLDELQIAVRQIARDGHRLLRRRRAASGVVVEECFRLGDLDVVIHREMVGPRIPTAVRRFVLVHQHEGFLGVSSRLEPIER